jgi:hypothetical protein
MPEGNQHLCAAPLRAERDSLTGWGGSDSGRSDGTRTVGDVWRPADRNKVKYFKYVPKPK